MYVYWFYGKITDARVKIVTFFLGGGYLNTRQLYYVIQESM